MRPFYAMINCSQLEIKKIQSSGRDHFQRIFNDHERLKLQLESQKRELDLRGVELEKREAHNESERKKLAEEIEEVFFFSLSLLLQLLNMLSKGVIKYQPKVCHYVFFCCRRLCLTLLLLIVFSECNKK